MKIFLKISYVETFYEDFIELASLPVTIGRDPASNIVLMGHDISRKHAELIEREGEVFLKDTESRTGIWHEGTSYKEIKIVEGMQLRIGAAILQFSFVQFPLEQTLSFGHDESHVHHEPFIQRIESFFTTKLVAVLFVILVVLAFLTAPDFYRRSDFSKNLAFLILGKSLFAPFLLSMVIVFVRKLNRGDYAWTRSLCMGYLFFIFANSVETFEEAFCWFNSFRVLWFSVPSLILTTSFFFVWWFFAVGKNSSLKNRFLRSLALSTIAYSLIFGFEYLSTGYRSNYEIEVCHSLTGWHWGEGEALSTVESFLSESAKELSKK